MGTETIENTISNLDGLKVVSPAQLGDSVSSNLKANEISELNKILLVESNKVIEKTLEISPKVEQLGIILKQDSKIDIFKQSEKEGKLKTKIFLKQGSELNYYTNNILLKKGKFKHVSYLMGEHSRANIYSLNLSKKQQQIKEEIQAIHKADRSSSDIRVKSVLKGQSRTASNVLTKVNKNCFSCSGEQQIDGLIHSDMAMMDAQPNLEIANDDVECSHGVTISKLSDEDIFYLLSRGLTREESYKKLTQAHFGEILSNIEDKEIQSKTKEQIQSRI